MAYPLSRTGCAAPAEKMDAPWGKTHGCGPSFRGDAKHRTRNLEIPRCAIAHLRSGPSDHSGMTRKEDSTHAYLATGRMVETPRLLARCRGRRFRQMGRTGRPDRRRREGRLCP